MKHGLWQLARWKGVPILLHWTVLLGLVLFGLKYQRIVPALLTFLGFFGLLLIHELGHAIAARSRSVHVFEIRLYLLHGLCSHAQSYRERDEVFIAWGGVLAQSVVLVLALAAQSIVATLPTSVALTLDPLLRVLTLGNAMMIAFNLIPVAPLDGHKAWRVLHPLRATLSSRFRQGYASFKRALNIRRRRTISKDADNKVVDLLERIKKNRK